MKNEKIKLRAWMKKEFIQPNANYDTFTISELMSGKFKFHQYENFELSTGLVDSKGKEIFVGDIVNDYRMSEDLIVFYSPAKSGFCLGREGEKTQYDHSERLDADAVTIVGNTYENQNYVA